IMPLQSLITPLQDLSPPFCLMTLFPAADGSRACALLYTDDSVYYDQCCGGKSLVVAPDSDVPYMPLGYSGRISSLVVGTGCQLNVWSRSGKKGKTKTFKAGAVPRLQEVKKGLLGNWDNAIRSYYCTCS
uniref:Syncollin n=1 Tax=Strigops habroptila TaxID=2489341 RepID=A0A672TJA4_STRHB